MAIDINVSDANRKIAAIREKAGELSSQAKNLRGIAPAAGEWNSAASSAYQSKLEEIAAQLDACAKKLNSIASKAQARVADLQAKMAQETEGYR